MLAKCQSLRCGQTLAEKKKKTITFPPHLQPKRAPPLSQNAEIHTMRRLSEVRTASGRAWPGAPGPGARGAREWRAYLRPPFLLLLPLPGLQMRMRVELELLTYLNLRTEPEIWTYELNLSEISVKYRKSENCCIWWKSRKKCFKG